MKKNTILVTGGAGYIGSHFILEALTQGYSDIIVLDDLSSGAQRALLGGTFYKGSISNRTLLQKIFQTHTIDCVFHFAGFIQVGESVSNPYKYYENNVSNTLTLLDEMHKAGVKNIVFSSTATIYGEPQYIPMDTAHPSSPINPYGMSKFFVENILKDFEHAYGLRFAVLRYFNAAGSDPEGRIGFHEPITHLIPNALKAATKRLPHIDIYGSDYPTSDGTCLRDYIHVMDLASAHLSAMRFITKNNCSALYNLGNGKGFSVREVINTIKIVTQKNFIVREMPRRAGDPPALIADIKKTQEALNWTPRYNLNDIIEHAYQWELNPIWHTGTTSNT